MKRNRSALLFSKCQMRRTINTCRPINCMVTICSFRSFYLWQKLVVDINNYYMYGYRCHRRFYAWVKLERGLCLTDPMLGSRSWLRAMSSFTPKLENKGNFSWGCLRWKWKMSHYLYFYLPNCELTLGMFSSIGTFNFIHFFYAWNSIYDQYDPISYI